MPIISIKSLPFEPAQDIEKKVRLISEEFAKTNQIAVEHIAVSWEYFKPGHYAFEGKTAQHQPQETHPLMVELLLPDFNTVRKIEGMLENLATTISSISGVSRNNVFINCLLAKSGMVMDSGRIVYWEQPTTK